MTVAFAGMDGRSDARDEPFETRSFRWDRGEETDDRSVADGNPFLPGLLMMTDCANADDATNIEKKP
jgi:hypothetical protein